VAAGCELVGVSRAGFYRHWGEHEPLAAEMELRHRIQQIALEEGNRKYGYRRIHRQLRREGWQVNHKRVLRLMREDNLLCVRKRKFALTTDSNHFWPVYPNLAAALLVEGTNQLWVADITYIRLVEQFVYLAVILDAYSRKVIGWELDDTLEARLAVAALQRALNAARRWGWCIIPTFPTGYSLAGCSPAEPAAASPVSASIGEDRGIGNAVAANGHRPLYSLPQPRGALQLRFDE
jgi:hypothetical protein